MKYFALSLPQLVLRFYLLMAIVIAAFFLHTFWLALLALPVFISCMLGIGLPRPSQRHAPTKALPQTLAKAA